MDNTLHFGGYIRHLRIAQRMGLRDAAKGLGITAGYLSKIETGSVAAPQGEVIQSIARFYNVAIQRLLDLAKERTVDVATADRDVGRALATFYRLAIGRPRDQQVAMVLAALNELDLPPDERRWWEERIKDLGEPGVELLRKSRGYNDLFDLGASPRRLTCRAIERLAEARLSRFYGGNIRRYEPPTPIEALIESDGDIDLDVVGDDLVPPFADGSPPILGLCRWTASGRRQVCVHERLLDADDSTSRRRANFTLGHEFFHAVEHLPLMKEAARSLVLQRTGGVASVSLRSGQAPNARRLRTAEDWREWQANTFSAAVLMPAFAVRTAFEEAFSLKRIEFDGPVLDEARDIACNPQLLRDGGLVTLVELFDVNPSAMGIRLAGLGLVVAGSSGARAVTPRQGLVGKP